MMSNTIVGDLSESAITTKRYVWKIPEFSSLPRGIGGCFNVSPSFTFMNNPFHFRVFPPKHYPEMFVTLIYESGSTRNVNYSISLRRSNGTLYRTESATACRKYCSYTAVSFKASELQSQKFALFPSGTLTLICDLKCDFKHTLPLAEVANNVKKKTAFGPREHTSLAELGVLSENLKDLSTNKDSCDIVLEVKDKEFKAHKLILMARSSVFAAMFQHDTLEKQTGIVKIPDCDPESFQEFLDYLYCGKLEDVSYHSAFQLYITSNKYDVQKLKEYCVEYLIESLTSDNVCEIAKLADKYDEERLLSVTQDFFIENMKQILVTTEWKNLMKNDYHLAHKLLIEFSKTK